ncbi:MAG: hypothetical protein LC800_07620 [Acidobacteria bacterium]|nr:hypothetical protein [Acidobacteriota bacterium]
MDNIIRKLDEVNWIYADKDSVALFELERRIAETGRKLGLITYSDLVKGIDFHLPNIRNGEAYRIQIYDWSGLDRAILGEFLGYISARSYRESGFMASALVVNSTGLEPSEQFFEWMERLGVLPDTNKNTVLAFWADQVHKAHNWFKTGRR